MPLRKTIRQSPELLSDLLIAAEDRYLDGEELLLQYRFDGAVYMFGYAAEMWLKLACLRLRGVPPTASVKAALGPLKASIRSLQPIVAFSDYRDLAFFGEGIFALRAAAGRPLPPFLARELRTNVITGLHEEWIVDMRYRRIGLGAADAWQALRRTWWVKIN